MINRMFFIGIFLLGMFSAQAQSEIVIKAEKMSDFYPQSMGQSFLKGYVFKVGEGDFQAIGHKAKNLEAVIKNDEAAYKEFKKFKKKVAIGKVTYWVGFIGLYSFPVVVDEYDTDAQMINKLIATVGTSLAGFTTTIILHHNAPKHLFNAVEIYNQNLKKE